MLILSATLIAAATAPSDPIPLIDELEAVGAAAGFLSALEESGMAQELAALGPITILAPTDEAFGALPPGSVARLFMPEARETLRDILSGHVVLAPRDAARLLGTEIPTLAGEPIGAEIKDGRLVIGGAVVAANDLRAGEATVHLVTSVLMPSADPEGDAVRRIAARALASGGDLGPAAREIVYRQALAAILEVDPSNRRAFDALYGGPFAGPVDPVAGALQFLAETPAMTSTDPGPDARALVNFDGSDGEPDWYILNDDVMGGISKSTFARGEDGVAVFEGQLSLENNGGFASVRTGRNEYDLDGAKGLRIRVRGDGREYALSALCTDGRGRTGSWRKRFTAPAGEWAVIDVPFEEMVLNIRGRRFPDVGPPKLDEVTGFSMLIGDKNTEPFRLEMDWIAAYR